MNTKRVTDRIAIGLIIAMMIMQLSLTKIFAKIIPIFNYSYNPPILCVLFVLIIAAVYVLVIIPRTKDDDYKGENCLKGLWNIIVKYKELIIILIVLLFSIIFTDIVTLIKGQLRISNILTHNLDYLYAFLALPLALLLEDESWKWESLGDIMLALTTASAALRIFVSVYYSLTGIEIEIISKESAGLYWFRNGRLRVTAPCFICLCFSIAVYLFFKTKSLVKRIVYIAECGIILVYAYFIWQARAGLVTILAGTAMMFFFGIMSRKQAYIRWGCVAVLAVIFIACGGLNKVISAFSMADDAQYVMENRGHYYAYSLFFGMLKESPFGVGLSETLAVWFDNGRAMWMCDAGIMYSLVPMGIFIGIFYLMMFARGAFVYLKNCKSSTMAVLALSLTAIIFVGELSMDCFFTPLAFEVPFYLAIVEFIAHRKADVILADNKESA